MQIIGLKMVACLGAVVLVAGCSGGTQAGAPSEAAVQTVTATVTVTATATETVTATATHTVTATASHAAETTTPADKTQSPPKPTTDSGTERGVLIAESGWSRVLDDYVSWGVVVHNNTGKDLESVDVSAVARGAGGELLSNGSETIDFIGAGQTQIVGGFVLDALGVEEVEMRVSDKGWDGEGFDGQGEVTAEGMIIDAAPGSYGDIGFEVMNGTRFELLDLLTIGYLYRDADGDILGGGRAILGESLGPGEGTGFTQSDPIPAGTVTIETQPSYSRDQFGNP